MPFYSPLLFKFLRFERSHLKNKKYNAVLLNLKTNREIRIPFGDKSYQQYEDKTPLKLYSIKDHNDKKRRQLYISRHAKDINKKYSASWFSLKYLW